MSLSNKLTTQKQESLWAYWEFLVLVSAKSNFGIIENLVFFYECVQFVGCIERLLEGGLGWETSPFQCSYWLHSRILKPLTILPHSGWQAGNPSAVWCVLDAVKSVPLADWEAGCSPWCLPDIWSAVVALLCHLFACLLFEECAIVHVSDSALFRCNSHIAEERLTRDTLPAHHDPLFHRAYLLLCSAQQDKLQTETAVPCATAEASWHKQLQPHCSHSDKYHLRIRLRRLNRLDYLYCRQDRWDKAPRLSAK